MFSAIAGADARDATTLDRPVPELSRDLEQSDRKFKIGVPDEYFQTGMDPEVALAVQAAIGLLGGLDCEFVKVSLPHTTAALATYYIINPSEVSSNLARFDGIRYGHSVLRTKKEYSLPDVYALTRDQGFGPEVKRRVLLGTFALSRGYADRYYLKAQRVRTLIRQDFENVFSQVDMLLTPTVPDVAFKIGAVQNPLTMYLVDVNMTAASLAGLPALSIPCGFVRGLPVGLQLIGPPFQEADLFAVGARYEAATEWSKQIPKI
jgi:aspartyl-tRNA(Asn)/glutamyl-tRNA(Gln) amidotransferase subunit A